MKYLLIFSLLFICFLGCAEDNENPLTSDDTDIPVNIIPAYTINRLPDANWELIADLERNPLRLNTFYVPDGKVEHLPDLTDVLNGAFAEGKHFIFVIYRQLSIEHVQFYLLQPAPPVFEESPYAGAGHIQFKIFKYQFPSTASWYTVQTVHDDGCAGLGVEFDLTKNAEWGPDHPQERKYWVPPQFFVSYDHLETGGYRIKDNVRLRIYVNR